MKKLKGIWTTLIIVILSVIMVMGVGGITALGATLTGDKILTTPTAFYTQFNYGQEYTIDGNVTVIAPNGITQTLTDKKFTANQVGAYTIKYNDYSYNVKCVMDKDYELRVNYGGADIATYLQVGKELTVPGASVWYKDDNGEYVKDSTAAVTYKIEGSTAQNASGAADKDNSVKMEDAGAFNVVYSALVGGNTGTKYLSTSFTVKVLTSFTDTAVPSLNVVNMPKNISLNTKVTLPTATFTDNYDTNGKVEVEVTYLDKATGKYLPVKTVKVDENGYGEVDPAGTDVVFDNKYNMSFYPMVSDTTYNIVYKAKDDAGNSASVLPFQASCVDKTAPILDEIADEQIPTKWGMNSVTRKKLNDADTNNVLAGTALNLNFPIPKYIDNSGKDTVLTTRFEIKDTVNNKVVAKFSDINTEEGRKYTYDSARLSNGEYPNALEFTDTGLNFSFEPYVNFLKDKTLAYTGLYTATYTIRDGASNSTTKSYDINMEEDFIDESAPSAKVSFLDDYLVITNDEVDFTIPTPVISDNSDTRPLISYKLISGDATNFIEVDGGETAVLQITNKPGETATKPYLVVNKNKIKKEYFELKGDLKYEISVTDDASNSTKLDNSKKVIQVLNADAFENWDNVLTANFDEIVEQTAELQANKQINVGDFKINVKDGFRDFVGFEMSITDAENNILSTKLNFKTFFDKTAKTQEIKDINFTPGKEGTYNLYIRIMDVTGRSKLVKYSYVVAADPNDDGGTTSATDLPLEGNVYTTYQLKNKTINTPGNIDTNRNYVVRTIDAGGRFGFMGSKFTAYTTGTYSFMDGYYETGKNVVTPLNKNAEYDITVTNNQSPAWNIQGVMPTYSDKTKNGIKAYVTLPRLTASADYANATIKLTAKNPSGTSMKVATKYDINNESGVFLTAEGLYKFEAAQDGTYTFLYTASYGDVADVTTEYTVKVGDIIAPTFNLETPHATTAKEGDTFTFKKVTITSEEDWSETDTTLTDKIRFVKRLREPDGTVKYEVNQIGKDGREAEKPDDGSEYKFTKSGVYTVEYLVYDASGNDSIVTYDIDVTAKKTNNPFSIKIVSTILIIVGALLIAGVILYFIRFRVNPEKSIKSDKTAKTDKNEKNEK